MSNKSKNKNHSMKKNVPAIDNTLEKEFWSMNYAPSLNKGYFWLQQIPIIFFTSIIIMIVFMKVYYAPMDGYYWHSDGTHFVDFFSYYKSVAILLTSILALIILLYRVLSQSIMVKKTWLYIPMIIYIILVLLSWLFSEYPFFAYHGYNERFEGSLILISYIIMLFYTFNTIHTEKNIEWVIYVTGATSSILGILGITQFLNHDFFRTEIGKKLITPQSFWDKLDSLNFLFMQGEVYQTVYNINYVSFYLNLLIPLFSFLFLWEKNIKKKIVYAFISALLIVNLFGAMSSGGFLGLGVAFIIALIIVNKRLFKWWKSISIILLAVVIIFLVAFNRIVPEISKAINSALISDQNKIHKQFIDYFDTDNNKLIISCNDEPIHISFDSENRNSFKITDQSGNLLPVKDSIDGSYYIADERFDMYKIKFIFDDGRHFLVVYIEDSEWPFEITDNGIFFFNIKGYLVDLDRTPYIGFEDRLSFGTDRGFIWSRSFPLVKDHILIGSGADTYVFKFPQNDYATKYNVGWSIYDIVDKPHNMYLGIAINTGLISLISLLTLFGAYIVWSIKLYWKNQFEDFISITGLGIFIGICGFLVAALVNDSSVSVMPMFYGLLGIGMAINFKLSAQLKEDNK